MINSGFDFTIDLASNCIFIKHYGSCNLEVVIERGKAVARHKDYRRGLNRLVVMTSCDLDMSSEDCRKLCDLIESQSSERGKYREAFVHDSLLGQGLARVFVTMKNMPGVEHQIFNPKIEGSPLDLRSWLGLDTNFHFPEFLCLPASLTENQSDHRVLK